MTVLQINVVYDEKSTGRTCKEVEKYLIKQGINCYTAYGVGKKNKGIFSYRIDSKAEYMIHNLMSRVTGLEGYFSYFATKRLIRYINKIKPDVVHLHNLHGHYLNLSVLFKFLKESHIPVVLNLHDCWIFTGKCTHPVRLQCGKWKESCENCPSKRGYPDSWLFDFSAKMFKDKVRFFDGLNIRAVIGVSAWVSEQAKMSFLGKYPVKYIYNWIDKDIFHPYKDRSIFDTYGVDKKKYTVICVAAAWKSNTQKNQELIQLSEKLGDKVQILVVGKESDSVTGKNVIPIGFVSNTKVLSQLYSASDVYVHLSSADTFGKVIAEAMACGTPVVAYDCTACSELVQQGCGKLVPLHDVTRLYEAVCEIRENGKKCYSEICINRVISEFDYEANCKRLLNVYCNTEG